MVVGETEATVDFMNRLNRQCFDKCLMAAIAEGSVRDGEMTQDDNTCIDKCAAKYISTQQKIGEISVVEFSK